MNTQTTQQTATTALAGKYLTFRLAEEEYGIEILKVQEIIKMMDITKVPRMPDFVRGVINLRGKVIPVVDLRLKFGMAAKGTTEKTCVVVVQLQGTVSRITMGAIVDEVSEVLDISADQIELPPEFGTTVDTAFILGMGKVGKKVIMLLDVDKVLSTKEMTALSQM
jgi:purine-binding chemotaxis protein CheW